MVIEIDHIDRETHRQGVHPMTRNDPQALSGRKFCCRRPHEAAQTGPVGSGHRELGGEIRLPGPIEGKSEGYCCWHRYSWVRSFARDGFNAPPARAYGTTESARAR